MCRVRDQRSVPALSLNKTFSDYLLLVLILDKLHILCQCLPCYQALDKNLRYFVPLLDQCCMYSYNIRAPHHQLKIKYIRRVNVSVNKKLKTSPPLPVQQVLIFPHSRPHNAHLDPLGVLGHSLKTIRKVVPEMKECKPTPTPTSTSVK